MTSCRSVSNITYHVYDSCLLHPLVPLFIHFVEHNRHGAHKPPWVSCSLCSHYPGYLVWETSVDFIVHVSWSLWYISPKLWCLVSFTIFLNKCILLLTCTYCISPCLFVECLCMGSNKDYFELWTWSIKLFPRNIYLFCFFLTSSGLMVCVFVNDNLKARLTDLLTHWPLGDLNVIFKM